MVAKLIAVEGPDKMGKQTQTKKLVESFQNNRKTAVLVEVPIKGLTHKVIYWMLENGLAKRFNNFFQFVQFLNKLSFQLFVLPFLLLKNDYIVLDRWSLSAIIYGDATGVNRTFNRLLYHLLIKPDMTLVLDGDSFKRSGKSDSYEKDKLLQKAVKSGYFNWALNHSKNHELVNNRGTVDEVQQRILYILAHTHITSEVMHVSKQ